MYNRAMNMVLMYIVYSIPVRMHTITLSLCTKYMSVFMYTVYLPKCTRYTNPFSTTCTCLNVLYTAYSLCTLYICVYEHGIPALMYPYTYLPVCIVHGTPCLYVHGIPVIMYTEYQPMWTRIPA